MMHAIEPLFDEHVMKIDKSFAFSFVLSVLILVLAFVAGCAHPFGHLWSLSTHSRAPAQTAIPKV